MPQNLAVQTAQKTPASAGVGFLQLDAGGNLKVTTSNAVVQPTNNLSNPAYATVAASQTAQKLDTGAVGDVLNGLLIIPGTTSPGAVSIKDATGGTSITVFAGGATSVASLTPFFVPLGARTTGTATPGWFVTTGANVTVVAVGSF